MKSIELSRNDLAILFDGIESLMFEGNYGGYEYIDLQKLRNILMNLRDDMAIEGKECVSIR